MSGRILVVEDDFEIRVTLTDWLRTEGYKVTEAQDGEEGFRALQQAPACVMLLDLFMPRLDGFGLLDKLDATPALKKPAIVLITAAPEHAPRQRVQHVVAKPFDVGDLLHIVAQYCSH